MSSAVIGRQLTPQASPGVLSVPDRRTAEMAAPPQPRQQRAAALSPWPRRCAALGGPPASSLRA
eukprot:11199424-Lingulodinium_polyedra.AAC.1